MATVFDVSGVSVVDPEGATLDFESVADITVSVQPDTEVSSVKVEVPASPEVIKIAVEGPQGPPGLPNVYVSTTEDNPTGDWGPEQENYVWIEVL